MSRLILLLAFVFSCFKGVSQSTMTQQEIVWLYRIVKKTPVLDRNWNVFFVFDAKPFTTLEKGFPAVNYNQVAAYQLKFPQSLKIDFEMISQSSPGLVSEAAVKLALWEMNDQLKRSIYHPNSKTVVYDQFYQTIKNSLPTDVKKKHQKDVIQTVIHPSLPIFKKIELLTTDYKLDGRTQKNLLNKWQKLVSDYSFKRSLYFFKCLAPQQSLSANLFLAAGDGSGTAGMLYEMELNPQDSSKTWYGKGIGLFSYQVKVKKDMAYPQSESIGVFSKYPTKAQLLHASMWGLDSSLQPMLVITRNDKSYHLFSNFKTQDLSVDDHATEGKSHLDRINEFEEKKLGSLKSELYDEGGLNEQLQKQEDAKRDIQQNIHRYELEIDSLKLISKDMTVAIDYRKKLINAQLTNLGNKESKIQALNSLLTTKLRELSAEETKLTAMKVLLGVNPQSWKLDNEWVVFDDGVRFNTLSQDLLFTVEAVNKPITVSLISGSYSLGGKNKDEVQACVSLCDVPLAALVASENLESHSFEVNYYFKPDEYLVPTGRLGVTVALSELKQRLAAEQPKVSVCFGIGVHKEPVLNAKEDSTLNNMSVLPSELADLRYVKAHVELKADSVLITIQASSDPVPTRLSKAPLDLKKALRVEVSSSENNQFLSLLRALCLLPELGVKKVDNLDLPAFLKPEERAVFIDFLNQQVK